MFDMFTPVDLVGKQLPILGGPLNKVNDANVQLLSLLENSGRGVLSADELEKKMITLGLKSPDSDSDLSSFLSFFKFDKVVDLGKDTEKAKQYIDANGEKASVKSLREIIGAKYANVDAKMPASVFLCRSPFFSPAVRNCKRAEIFLNAMPNTVVAQLVPFLQAEFQIDRSPSEQLQSLSQLKLLMGAVNKKSLSGANKAMLEGQQANSATKEVDFFGMEMFTSPQTLTNPQPNKSVGTSGLRYVDVIDPFRPFATLENVNISAKPSGAGYYCYKKAQMTIKIHDRSRLNEISDLIRPRVYTGVTIWLTYGWRAPTHQDKNPYFKYVNDNMMMREAYHIVNSSFSFDAHGQVTLNLELFTKGVIEIRDLKISDNMLDMSFRIGEVQRLTERISAWRKRLRLDPQEGLSKEVRVFQILDSAEVGEFPDMAPDEIQKRIDALHKSLLKASVPDKDAVNGLIVDLKKLYQVDTSDKKKFDFKKRYKTRVTHIIEEMFHEVQTGPDPFLPIEGKSVDEELVKTIAAYVKQPVTKTKDVRKSIVSFGKLFTVFALRSMLSMPDTVDEVQVFFYALNSQCGPVSGHSVAEFPINIAQFKDQFVLETTTKGGEKMTLETFLSLCINAQFLDNRAIGYGLSSYYEPFAIGKEAAIKKDQEGAYEGALAAQTSKYGAFHKPVIELYVETSHERVSDDGENDILASLNYSAITSVQTTEPKQQPKSKRIMRLHIYDKQTNAYRAAGALLRSSDGKSFIVSAREDKQKFVQRYNQNVAASFEQIKSAAKVQLDVDVKSGNALLVDPFANNQMIKDVVSKLVPTIRFGSNGSTIVTANLSSKAEPLLSTVQMQKTMTVRNNASPNGSGELGVPLRVIPAVLTMTSLGNPLATMAQNYFIDFQTGTTLDNLYIVTGLTHTFTPGKFETQWNFGYSDAYGVFEGAPNIDKAISEISPTVPKEPGT